MNAVKANYEQLLQRWHGLTKREQWLAGVLSVVLLIAFLVNGILNPIIDGREQARRNLEANRRLYSEVVAGANRIQALQAQGSAMPLADLSRPVDERVRRAAQQSSIAIHRMNMQQNSLQVVLGEIPFATLTQWLANLEQQAIVVRSLQINQSDKPGVVSVDQLRLVEAG